MWPAAYTGLLEQLKNRTVGERVSGRSDFAAASVALRLVDVLLEGSRQEDVDLAAIVKAIDVPSLRAAGYIRLARAWRSAETLRSALISLDALSAGDEGLASLAAAIADTAIAFNDREIALAALSRIPPGQVHASIASRLMRNRGVDPTAFPKWPEEVERLERNDSLQAAIDLAIAADARAERKIRDEALRELSLEALGRISLSAALTAVEAIYSPRMRGLAQRDVVSSLLDDNRVADALALADDVSDPRSAVDVWLKLADAGDEQAVRERLSKAFAAARSVEETTARDDYTADVLKRIAEKGWYAAATARTSCITDKKHRRRVVSASAKRGSSDAPDPRGPAPHLRGCESDATEPAPFVGSVSAKQGLIDAAARRAFLETSAGRNARRHCAVADRSPDFDGLDPIEGLRSTEAYGSDQRAETFSWSVMLLAGRHLAGDAEASAQLSRLMVNWASAGAFEKTEVSHDAYYALKRSLLPTVAAFTLIEGEMNAEGAETTRRWLDGLVRHINRRFGGDVDINNHRYLADSVQMLWGSWTGDVELFNRGIASLERARQEIRGDGSLPLETRRGSRALWYMRQSAASFAVMIELLRAQGFEDLADRYRKELLDPVAGFIVDGVRYPAHLLVYTGENYIAGPSPDYFEQDLGFLDQRGHGRHYMAWIEPAIADPNPSVEIRRLRLLADMDVLSERPLIDEFAGGNATCFWANERTTMREGLQ